MRPSDVAGSDFPIRMNCAPENWLLFWRTAYRMKITRRQTRIAIARFKPRMDRWVGPTGRTGRSDWIVCGGNGGNWKRRPSRKCRRMNATTSGWSILQLTNKVIPRWVLLFPWPKQNHSWLAFGYTHCLQTPRAVELQVLSTKVNYHRSVDLQFIWFFRATVFRSRKRKTSAESASHPRWILQEVGLVQRIRPKAGAITNRIIYSWMIRYLKNIYIYICIVVQH